MGKWPAGARRRRACALFTASAAALLLLASGASAAVLLPSPSASFHWSPASGPVAGYQIQVARNGGAWADLATSAQPATILSFPPGTAFQIRVAAFDAQGNLGPWSAASQVFQLPGSSAPAGSTADGAGGSTGSGTVGALEASAFNPSSVDPSDPRTALADVNGDGKLDLLRFDTSSKIAGLLSDRIATASGYGPARLQLIHGPSTPGMMQYADVNGDGKADALYFDTSRTSEIWVALSTGTGFTKPKPWLKHGPSTPDMIQYADVNGDGKADALYFDTSRSSEVWVALSTGHSFTTPTPWLKHGPSTPDMIQYADVNGDGMADALYFDVWRSGEVWVALSTGEGFTAPVPWGISPDTQDPHAIRYADIDGDGKADAVLLDDGGSEIRVAYSTGSRFTHFRPWISLPNPVSPSEVTYVDLDGNGMADALVRPLSGGVLIGESRGISLPPQIIQPTN